MLRANIRNDVCYPRRSRQADRHPAGFLHGTLGPTHHALEDATIMATLPGMTVFSPATISELDRFVALSKRNRGSDLFSDRA